MGEYVVKIYAPKESGMDQTESRQTELFAANFAEKAGAAIPSVVACGEICDTYSFAYMIMKYIKGRELGEVLANIMKWKSFTKGFCNCSNHFVKTTNFYLPNTIT